MSEGNFESIRKAYHPQLVIMVVEDHVLFSKEVKHALPDHHVLLASSIEHGKAQYTDALPNIVFLDIDLPDGNGFLLLDFIRSREPDAHVVMLTGSKLEEDVRMAKEKGANGYIIKPFTRVTIQTHVNEYLALREKRIQGLLAETEKSRQQGITPPPPEEPLQAAE